MDAEIFDSGMKKMRIQKYPDTFGRGLNRKLRVKLVKVRKFPLIQASEALTVFTHFFTLLIPILYINLLLLLLLAVD